MDKYKHFFYYNLDLACFTNPEGDFEELNDNFTKVLEYTPSDLVGKKIFDFIHPDDIEPTLKEMEKLALGSNIPNFINRFKTKTNTYKYLEWSSAINLETKHVYALGRDVTKKMIANEELVFQNKERENRAAELIIANQKLAFQNEEKEKRAAELIIANEELVFQNREKEKRAAELIIANRELAFQNEEKEKRAAELIIANKELVFQNKEKENRAAELIIANQELTKAESRIRKLNEELEQKVNERTAKLEFVNKELESFSYSVAHDLRSPLRAINGMAKILEEDYATKFEGDGIKILQSIMWNSIRMGELIDDLLSFSRLGRKQIDISEIDMNALAETVCDELLVGEEKNRIEFKTNELSPINGDRALIKQVWVNLISNAIKYSKSQSKANIELGSYVKNDFVVYYVKDNGAGFNMEYYDKLFGVFQRLHSHEEFEGTGIGLAIAQKIVVRHNGTIWAESKVNEGACFYFNLPKTNHLD